MLLKLSWPFFVLPDPLKVDALNCVGLAHVALEHVTSCDHWPNKRWWSMVSGCREWCYLIAGWWFGTFFIFPYIGNNHPNWLIFFRGVETTNQIGCVGVVNKILLWESLSTRYIRLYISSNIFALETTRAGLAPKELSEWCFDSEKKNRKTVACSNFAQ